MTRFDKFHEHTRMYEGGYVDIPEDKGGPTNFGISQKFLDSVFGDDILFFNALGLNDTSKESIRAMTESQAKKIYKKYFYDGYDLDYLPIGTAFCLYDMGVNHGRGIAVRLIQRACNQFESSSLIEDGIYGLQTKEQLELNKDDLDFLRCIKVQRELAFKAIVKSNPNQEKFLKGWLNRAQNMHQSAIDLILD